MIKNKTMEEISSLVCIGCYPNFSFLVGNRGSGRFTIATWIAEQLNLPMIEVGKSAEEIRNLMNNIDNKNPQVVYVVRDADSMSQKAVSALLKTCEDLSGDTYVILTMTSQDVPNTLKSRGRVFVMQPYSQAELYNYWKRCYPYSKPEYEDYMTTVCTSPYEIDLLEKYGVTELLDFVDLVVDNIAEVTTTNVFKLTERLALTKDSDGYDLELFLRFFLYSNIGRFEDYPIESAQAVSLTVELLQKIKKPSANKVMLVGCWILDIRKVYANN